MVCLTFGGWGWSEGGEVQVSQLAWQRYLWRAASVTQRSALSASGWGRGLRRPAGRRDPSLPAVNFGQLVNGKGRSRGSGSLEPIGRRRGGIAAVSWLSGSC